MSDRGVRVEHDDDETAAIAHDLANVVTLGLMTCELALQALDGIGADEVVDDLRGLEAELMRARRLVTRLVQLHPYAVEPGEAHERGA